MRIVIFIIGERWHWKAKIQWIVEPWFLAGFCRCKPVTKKACPHLHEQATGKFEFTRLLASIHNEQVCVIF